MTFPVLSRMANKPLLACILGSYFLLCGAMLPWFLHRVGPDTVSYLTIARKYRVWEFSDAINGYWSPLLSWLLAPLLCLGLPTEVTARVLQVVIGAVGLAVVWWLGKRLELAVPVRVWTTLALVPAVAMYALSDTTPDLLVAVILAVYIGVVIGPEYPRSPWQGAACGLLGALAYLAKAYAFPFFLTHYLAVSGYLVLRRRSSGGDVRRLAAATAAGLLVFAVVAGSWAGLLTRKYSRITIGTTGAFQFRLAVQGSPIDLGGLYPPANSMAVSAWEDPSDLRIVPRQPATKAATNPTPTPSAKGKGKPLRNGWQYPHMLYRIYRNGISYTWTLFRLSPMSPCILVGLLISCWIVPRGLVRDRSVILLGTMLLYPAGYLMIHISERFFWLMTFLLSLSAGLLATALPVLRRNPWYGCWAVVAMLSFAPWPVWILAHLRHHVLEEMPAVASDLRPLIPPGTRIASDREWGITNSIAYHLDARYFGLLRPSASAEEQARQLRDYRIQYLLVWGDPARYSFLAAGREVAFEHVAGSRHPRWPRIFEFEASVDQPHSSGADPVDRP